MSNLSACFSVFKKAVTGQGCVATSAPESPFCGSVRDCLLKGEKVCQNDDRCQAVLYYQAWDPRNVQFCTSSANFSMPGALLVKKLPGKRVHLPRKHGIQCKPSKDKIPAINPIKSTGSTRNSDFWFRIKKVPSPNPLGLVEMYSAADDKPGYPCCLKTDKYVPPVVKSEGPCTAWAKDCRKWKKKDGHVCVLSQREGKDTEHYIQYKEQYLSCERKCDFQPAPKPQAELLPAWQEFKGVQLTVNPSDASQFKTKEYTGVTAGKQCQDAAHTVPYDTDTLDDCFNLARGKSHHFVNVAQLPTKKWRCQTAMTCAKYKSPNATCSDSVDLIAGKSYRYPPADGPYAIPEPPHEEEPWERYDKESEQMIRGSHKLGCGRWKVHKSGNKCVNFPKKYPWDPGRKYPKGWIKYDKRLTCDTIEAGAHGVPHGVGEKYGFPEKLCCKMGKPPDGPAAGQYKFHRGKDMVDDPDNGNIWFANQTELGGPYDFTNTVRVYSDGGWSQPARCIQMSFNQPRDRYTSRLVCSHNCSRTQPQVSVYPRYSKKYFLFQKPQNSPSKYGHNYQISVHGTNTSIPGTNVDFKVASEIESGKGPVTPSHSAVEVELKLLGTTEEKPLADRHMNPKLSFTVRGRIPDLQSIQMVQRVESRLVAAQATFAQTTEAAHLGPHGLLVPAFTKHLNFEQFKRGIETCSLAAYKEVGVLRTSAPTTASTAPTTRAPTGAPLTFAGPFTQVTTKRRLARLASLFANSTFYVGMKVKTGSTIGGDILLIGSSGVNCSGLQFYLRPQDGGVMAVGHKVRSNLLMPSNRPLIGCFAVQQAE